MPHVLLAWLVVSFTVTLADDSFTCRTAQGSFSIFAPSSEFEVDYSVSLQVRYLGFHEGVTGGALMFQTANGGDSALSFNISFDSTTTCRLLSTISCVNLRNFTLGWPHSAFPLNSISTNSNIRWTLAGVVYQPGGVDVFHPMAPGCPTFGVARAPDVACSTPTCVVSVGKVRRLVLGPRVVQVVVASATGVLTVGTIDATEASSAGVRIFAPAGAGYAPLQLPVEQTTAALQPFFRFLEPLCLALVRVGVLLRVPDAVGGVGISRVCVVATVRNEFAGVAFIERGAWIVGASGTAAAMPSASLIGSPTSQLGVPPSDAAPSDASAAVSAAAAAATVPPVAIFGLFTGVSSRTPLRVQRVAMVTRSTLRGRALAVTGPGGIAAADGADGGGGRIVLIPTLPSGSAFDAVGYDSCVDQMASTVPSAVSSGSSSSSSTSSTSSSASTSSSPSIPALLPSLIGWGIGDRLVCGGSGVLISLCGATVGGPLILPPGSALDLSPGCNDRTDTSGLARNIGTPPLVHSQLSFTADPAGLFVQKGARYGSTHPPTTGGGLLLVQLGDSSSGPLMVARGGVVDFSAAAVSVSIPNTPSPTAAQLVTFGLATSGLGVLVSPPRYLSATLIGQTADSLTAELTWSVGFAVAIAQGGVPSATLEVRQVTIIPTLFARAGLLVCPLLDTGWHGGAGADGSGVVDGVILRDNIARLQRFVANVSLHTVNASDIAYQGADTLTAAALSIVTAPLPPDDVNSVPSPVGLPHSVLGTSAWERTQCSILMFAASADVVGTLGCATSAQVRAAAATHLPASIATADLLFISVTAAGYPKLVCEVDIATKTPPPPPAEPPISFDSKYKIHLYGLLGLIFPVVLVMMVVYQMLFGGRNGVDRGMRLEEHSNALHAQHVHAVAASGDV